MCLGLSRGRWKAARNWLKFVETVFTLRTVSGKTCRRNSADSQDSGPIERNWTEDRISLASELHHIGDKISSENKTSSRSSGNFENGGIISVQQMSNTNKFENFSTAITGATKWKRSTNSLILGQRSATIVKWESDRSNSSSLISFGRLQASIIKLREETGAFKWVKLLRVSKRLTPFYKQEYRWLIYTQAIHGKEKQIVGFFLNNGVSKKNGPKSDMSKSSSGSQKTMLTHCKRVFCKNSRKWYEKRFVKSSPDEYFFSPFPRKS